jgi:hypothetical protein
MHILTKINFELGLMRAWSLVQVWIIKRKILARSLICRPHLFFEQNPTIYSLAGVVHEEAQPSPLTSAGQPD